MITYNGQDFRDTKHLREYLYQFPLEYMNSRAWLLDEKEEIVSREEYCLSDLRNRLIDNIIKRLGLEYKLNSQVFVGSKEEIKKQVLAELSIANVYINCGRAHLFGQPLILSGSIAFNRRNLRIKIGKEIDNL